MDGIDIKCYGIIFLFFFSLLEKEYHIKNECQKMRGTNPICFTIDLVWFSHVQN
jgi:hypothetical protein